MSKRLNRVRQLDEDVRNRFVKFNIKTCKDVLSKNELELLQILDMPLDKVKNVINIVSEAILPPAITVASMISAQHDKPAFLATKLSALDKSLHGGIPAASITEVVGPAGVGKTQFCQMLAIFATLKNKSSLESAIYIDSESAFTAQRLVEIARANFPNATIEQMRECTSRVIVYQNISSSDKLTALLSSLEEVIITRNVKLLILDSIAAVARRAFDTSSIKQRQQELGKEASLLKYIAETFNIPVVVTNQVTTTTKSPYKMPSPFLRTFTVTAALGTLWAHCVNTRLVLDYHSDSSRKITVAKSPSCSVLSYLFAITEKGIELRSEQPLKIDSNFWNHEINTRPDTAPGLTLTSQHSLVTERQEATGNFVTL